MPPVDPTQQVAEAIRQADADLWDGEAHFNMATALVYAQAAIDALGLTEEVCAVSGGGGTPTHGLLHFDCPKCGETLAVGLHIVGTFSERGSRVAFGTHYGHPVEFVAEAPHLHARFWGHLVRCHQPNPHPYSAEEAEDVLR